MQFLKHYYGIIPVRPFRFKKKHDQHGILRQVFFHISLLKKKHNIYSFVH